MRQEAPWLRVVDLEGGHSVNIEASDGFDASVLTFLDGADSRFQHHLSGHRRTT